MYLREDLSSGKLYGSTPGSNETLLHDYTLGIGDSMLVDGIYHYVTNLSTTTIQNNQQRYTIVFDSLYSLIDGIGSTNKFLSAVNVSGPFSSYILACAQQNNSPLYGSYCIRGGVYQGSSPRSRMGEELTAVAGPVMKCSHLPCSSFI